MYIIEHAHIEICKNNAAKNRQVSFAEFSLYNRALLQKRPILGSLPIQATPSQGISENNAAKNRQVSFAEYRLFCRSLLQKRPMMLGSLLILATPYPDMSENNAAKNRHN